MKFIPYVCCGDPNIDFTYELVKVLVPYSSMIELGIPFSDPIADGRTIQAAANRALKNGVNVEKIFAMVERLRKEEITTQFVFMTYYNIVYSYGCENFLNKMQTIGVQGIIIPDLPFGEDIKFEKLAKKYEISIINLIAPNTRNARAHAILGNSNLFTYLVSIAGTTGVRDKVSENSLAFVKRVRALAINGQKLFVGFGISDVEQAKQFISAGADGVIVGSKLIEIYSKHIDRDGIDAETALKKIAIFSKSFINV